MNRLWKFLAAGAAVALASCSSIPEPRVAPPSRVAEPVPLPYHWTQGNAPQAHADAPHGAHH